MYTFIHHHFRVYTAGASESEGGSDDSDDETLKDITFAPSDVPELSMVEPKVDQFGLGYTPLSRIPVLGGHINLFDSAPLSITEKKKKLLIKGQVRNTFMIFYCLC